MASRILLTALELNIFGRLDKQCLSAEEVAGLLQTDKRATEVLLNALVGLELLEKKDGLYSNSEEIADLLSPESPNYMGAGLLHTGNLWNAWSHLTETVKTGRPHVREWTEKMGEGLALAMKQQAKGVSERLVRSVECSKVNRMLDVGGGPGSYAIQFARHNPHLEAVIFDMDEQALRIAGEEIEAEGLQDRITLKKGDFLKDDIGDGFDLALISFIVSILDEEHNIALLRKVKDSLNDGGRALILDALLDDSKTKPTATTIFAVRMLVATLSGRCYSHREVAGWLNQLGFQDAHRIPMENMQLIVATK